MSENSSIVFYDFFGTPAGDMLVASCSFGVCLVSIQPVARAGVLRKDLASFAGRRRIERRPAALKTFRRQIESYFQGRRRRFSIPLDFCGTDFERKVWKALLSIPYGRTRTYSQVARQIGHPKAARAVGMACHKNPLGILVPCHRVVGSGGALTGYSSGLDIKRKLLDLEGRPAARR